jgi:hypothetical protein
VSPPPHPVARWLAAHHRRGRILLGGLVGAATLTLVLVAGCSGPPTVDRDQAVAQVLASSGGQMTAEQARCYVNRVIDEVGADQLQPGAQPSPSQIAKLTSIRIDCIGVANLGRDVPDTGSVPGTGTIGTSAHREPQHLGDDPELDALYRACQQGDGQSCDQLFDQSAPGSDYEEFAVTCGNRTREVRCADMYHGGATSSTPSTGR